MEWCVYVGVAKREPQLGRSEAQSETPVMLFKWVGVCVCIINHTTVSTILVGDTGLNKQEHRRGGVEE